MGVGRSGNTDAAIPFQREIYEIVKYFDSVNYKNVCNRPYIIPDALVDGYQALIPSIAGLPDPDDRHVVAAALVGRVDVIVTYNLRDFPHLVLTPYNIEAQHPDDFIRHLIDLHEARVCEAVKKQRAALKRPAKTIEEFLDTLASNHCRKPLQLYER